MILIKSKYFIYFFYNLFAIVFFSFFVRFYFFNKEEGNFKYQLYKKKLIELDEKKENVSKKNENLKKDLKKWKNQFSKRECFSRENLDLIKEGEILIHLKYNENL